jgi:hypothetical protein
MVDHIDGPYSEYDNLKAVILNRGLAAPISSVPSIDVP